MNPVLYIVIPCYNEETVLPVTAPLFLDKLQELIERNKVEENRRILFVDDGSRDQTWDCIVRLQRKKNTLLVSNKAATGDSRMLCWPV